MIERKIYSPWAFTENEEEKRNINREIYKSELEGKLKYIRRGEMPTEEDKKLFVCYTDTPGYAQTTYRLYSNPFNLSDLQLALLCDSGNLCFGYRGGYPSITIHTD